jgi:hypothetical protein
MARANNHDSTGLPPGFTYLDPPADWPRSQWDDPLRLKLMALSFRLLLVGDRLGLLRRQGSNQ